MEHTQTWVSRHITLHDYADPKAERENAFSHLLGAIASVLFLAITITKKDAFGSSSTFMGMVIYAASLLLLYGSSTLYHHLPKGDLKRIFRFLDHANIYLLIAGTYTPILMSMQNASAYRLLAIVWSVAITGILFSLICWGKLKVLHVLFYLAMGWMIVFFWKDIVPFIPSGLLIYIIAAGLTYTVGVAFYAAKGMPHSHMIWHVFCIVASTIFCVGFLVHLI
ncbi:MAG: DNA-binding protein [Spirochaetae bacterium HGW-Spirochaetae-2]|nr:MAG: DNA-binding protein [Spirochaetae bacterium HGW-Spirochaetae-2]